VKAISARAKARIRAVAADLRETDDCWLWPLYCGRGGYGVMRSGPRTFLVHRVAHEALIGPIPPGLLVLHRCDVPRCFNPRHLFAGTQQDNMVDMMQKGRIGGRVKCGVGNNLSKLTDAAVRDIRASTASLASLGRKYGVTYQAVAYAKRVGWKHLNPASQQSLPV
jgi:hypothetical protein